MGKFGTAICPYCSAVVSLTKKGNLWQHLLPFNGTFFPVCPGSACSVKNPSAVLLGRLGGLKGGAARAAALSQERRIEIAKMAANTRWHGKEET